MLLNLEDDKIILSVNEFKEAERNIKCALETQGEHHKQWLLHEIAKALSIDTSGLGLDVEEGKAP